MSSQNGLDVAIVGGGMAGLSLAIGLLKHPNIKLTIYEAAHHFGEIGAGVALGPSATRAMNLIDPKITEVMERVATNNQWKSKERNWFEIRQDNGELIHTIKCDGGQETVHRADFLDELIKLVPQNIAHFGKRVTDVEDLGDKGIHLKFKDGTEATHGCVVGCDGIKSAIRHYLFGDSPISHAHFSGKYCHRGLIPMDVAIATLGEELAVNNQVYVGKHGHVITFPVQKGKTMNVVAMSSQDSWDDPNWVVHSDQQHLLADYKGWGPIVSSIIPLMQNTDIWALFDFYDHPAPIYYKGRVCVMGDAAHATTPHQGSGAGMAIEDAYVLSNLLGDVKNVSEIEKVFEAYDAVRRERTLKLVVTSRQAGNLWELEVPEYGDDLSKYVNDMDNRLRWIWNEDLQAEVAEAKKIIDQ